MYHAWACAWGRERRARARPGTARSHTPPPGGAGVSPPVVVVCPQQGPVQSVCGSLPQPDIPMIGVSCVQGGVNAKESHTQRGRAVFSVSGVSLHHFSMMVFSTTTTIANNVVWIG